MESNKRRLLIVSCSIILLCMISIVGMTFALFTDSVSVINHLKAGELDVNLYRTNLEYKAYDSQGNFNVVNDSNPVDFSDPQPNKSIFGLDSSNITLVPTMYFEATLKLEGNADCWYDYSCTFVLGSGVDMDLADQVQVTITYADTNKAPASFRLSSLASSGYTLEVGTMEPGTRSEEFKIKILFENDPAHTLNNAVMGKEIAFDLIVEAVQKT